VTILACVMADAFASDQFSLYVCAKVYILDTFFLQHNGTDWIRVFFNVGSRIDDFCNDIEGIAPKTIRVTCSGLVTYLVFQDLSILVLMCVCYLYHLYFVLNLSIHSFNRCISFSPPSNYYDGLFGTSSTSRVLCYLCTS
jgi:hypothetical protein